MSDAGGDIPYRSKLRPSDIKPLLPWVTMAERQGTRHLIPTIVGSAIDDVLQASFTGVNLFDFMPKEVADRFDAFYTNITDIPCCGHMVRTLAGENGLMRGYHSTQLPLRSASGQIDRLVGIVSVSKEQPLLTEFGKPQDIQTVDITAEDYIDLGFGVPKL